MSGQSVNMLARPFKREIGPATGQQRGLADAIGVFAGAGSVVIAGAQAAASHCESSPPPKGGGA